MNLLYLTLLRPYLTKKTSKQFIEGYIQALVSLEILMRTQKDELHAQDLYDTLLDLIKELKRKQNSPCLIE